MKYHWLYSLFFCCINWLLTPDIAIAQQFKEPSGPVYEAIVKAQEESLQQHDISLLKNALPAMEKAFPGHPYTSYFQGFYAHATGDINTALIKYSEAIRLMPAFAWPYSLRAGLLAGKGLYEKAAADITQSIQLQQGQAPAKFYSERGDYYSMANLYQAAFSDFLTAIKKEPAEAAYYRGLINTGLKAGKADSIDLICSNALRTTQLNNASVRIAYANFLLRQQKFTDANKQFSNAIATNDDVLDAKDYNNAAIAAYKLKDYNRANALLDKGIALNASEIDLFINRSNVAIDQRQWETAYTFAQKALALDSENAMANMLMAVSIRQTNRGDALAAQYEAKAKKLDSQ